MVGSTFIHTTSDKRRTLINVAQVAAIYTKDIELASAAGQLEYRRYSLSLGTIYTIQLMLATRREMEYVFATAAERDVVYNQMLSAIAPAVFIENKAPTVPTLEKERLPKPHKPDFPNVLFDTEDEYEDAVAQVMRTIRSAKMVRVAAEEKVAAAQSTPKPPRKPYTRKPRE